MNSFLLLAAPTSRPLHDSPPLLSMSVQRFKVVLLGEGRVGKTSILLRYTKGEYNDRQVSTLQASYLDKKVSVGGITAQLSVWDTAGQER